MRIRPTESAGSGRSSAPQRPTQQAGGIPAGLQAGLGNRALTQALAGEGALAPIVSAQMQLSESGAVPPGDVGLPSSNSVAVAVMRRARGGDVQGVADPRLDLISARGGTALPASVRGRMEAAFGRDFSHVRIHVGAGAAAAADALDAEAFATGSEIWFASGAWAPGSARGDELLAHELQHVVQADEGRVGPSLGNTLSVSGPHDSLESEADARADAVLADLGQVDETAGPAVADSIAPQEPSAPTTISRRIKTQSSSIRPSHERKMSIPTNRGSLKGQTFGMHGVHVTPSEESDLVGILPGDPLPCRVTNKVADKESGAVWYEVEFGPKAAAIVAADLAEDQLMCTEVPSSLKGWISGGVAPILRYEQFIEQIRAFDKLHSEDSVASRVTLLRQMAQPGNLPFDTVIGSSAGSIHLENRAKLSHRYQLLADAQAVEVPDGSVVDMAHLFVGIDALQPGHAREQSSITKYGLTFELGKSYAAATWAGDVGAAAADAAVGKDQDWEASHSADTASVRTHYFETRAPDGDLLGDIDAWGMYDEVDEQSSVADLLEGYYGRAGRDGAETVSASRKRAFARFLGASGFTSGENLKGQHPRGMFVGQILAFGLVWLLKNYAQSAEAYIQALRDRGFFGNAQVLTGDLVEMLGWAMNPFDEDPIQEDSRQLLEESQQMADILLDWIEKQSNALGAVPAADFQGP